MGKKSDWQDKLLQLGYLRTSDFQAELNLRHQFAGDQSEVKYDFLAAEWCTLQSGGERAPVRTYLFSYAATKSLVYIPAVWWRPTSLLPRCSDRCEWKVGAPTNPPVSTNTHTYNWTVWSHCASVQKRSTPKPHSFSPWKTHPSLWNRITCVLFFKWRVCSMRWDRMGDVEEECGKNHSGVQCQLSTGIPGEGGRISSSTHFRAFHVSQGGFFSCLMWWPWNQIRGKLEAELRRFPVSTVRIKLDWICSKIEV